jgi:gliding motility-associated-like protein
MKKIYEKVVLIIGISLAIAVNGSAQLTVSNTLTPTQLVQNVLLGSGVQAFNITYTGDTGAMGYFDGSASNIGIPSGVMLTTGQIWNAPGPNNTCSQGTSNSLPGDTMLDNIITGTTYDACILEFDFIPIGDTVKFTYVFGSEEYNEFVNSTYNDVFAFFIRGPGIIGYPNMALIPSTSTPVSINNVNDGYSDCDVVPSGPCTNCAYYIDNTGGLTVQYDGFTTPLVALHWVIPCDTYHIKIAIADVGDYAYDSGVMLKQGSFTGGSAYVSTHATDTLLGDTIVRGCISAEIIISILDTLTHDTTVHFTLSGTAINGIDYSHLPDSVVIQAGSIHDTLIINPLPDTIDYSLKYVVIGITFATGCNTTALDSVILPIKNPTKMWDTVYHNDTTICWGDPAILIVNDTGGFGAYHYLWNPNVGTSDTIIVYPIANTLYHVTTTDGCFHSKYDSIKVNLVNSPHVLAPDSVSIVNCGTGYFVFLMPSTLSTNEIIHFTIGGTAIGDTDYISIADSAIIYAGQLTDTIYITALHDSLNINNRTVVITYPSCNGNDSIKVTIVNVNPIDLTTNNDTTICYPNNVTLHASSTGGHGAYIYNWDHGLGSNAIQTVAPDSTTTYNVSVTDSCGNVQIKSITVNVQIPDSLTLLDIPAAATCHDGKIVFTLPIALSNATTITYTIGGSAANGTDYTMLSGNITIPAGQTTDTLTINALVNMTDTTTNKTLTITIQQPSACGNTITITIPVIDVLPMKSSMTPDSVLCVGQSIDLITTTKGGYIGYNYVWNNGLGNSSSNTANPIVTTTYLVAINDSCGHSLIDSVNVRIIPHPKVGLTIAPLDSMCTYDNAIVTFSDTLLGVGISSINFGGATINSGSGLGPYNLSWANPGFYTITFATTTEKNCFLDSSQYTLYIKDCYIAVPNVFTPNGDGKNDFFSILNMDEFPNSRLVIFNRWGEKVLDDSNYHNTWNGNNCRDGTYYYILYLNTGKQLHGYLTIIGSK